MTGRPNYIDLSAPRSLHPSRTGTPSPRDLPSPRSGDVPPALSPLDAFALQSRMLARRLEDSHLDGHRISRLPPDTIASELAKTRNTQFGPRPPQHTGSASSTDPSNSASTGAGETGTVQQPTFRPQSLYPSIYTPSEVGSEATGPGEWQNHASLSASQRDADAPRPANEYFSLPRTGSPEPMARQSAASPERVVQSFATHGPPPVIDFRNLTPPPGTAFRIPHGQLGDPSLLLPSRSPAFSRSTNGSSSIRSVPMDSGDDSDNLSLRGDGAGELRGRQITPSGHTIHSRPRSPFSPVFAPARSPSMSSERSVGGTQLPRQSFNFSRPLSRASQPISRPSVDSTSHHVQENSQLRPSLDLQSNPDIASPPFSPSTMPDRPSFDLAAGEVLSSDAHDFSTQPAPSYIYAKYSLPRGRIVSRDSMMMNEDSSTHLFSWEPTLGASSNSIARPIEHSTSDSDLFQQVAYTQPSANQSFASPSIPFHGNAQHSRSRSADNVEAPLRTPGSPIVPVRTPVAAPAPSISSGSTTSTERPRSTTPTGNRRLEQRAPVRPREYFTPLSATSPVESLTPEEHLSRGIACHQEDALQKSTYHLRIAARAGLPTAMLLYALACRHGWGMRPNPGEGVTWLRKAVDVAGQEVAWDEGRDSSDAQANDPARTDPMSRKTHKAQFALSIYELGVSYMNGWGIGQDRTLALRCFEIAGNWGDADALAEAGFCYAKGVGCKKDLKHAASLYRQAAARGVEMAGNSWIYKDKYMPAPSKNGTTNGATTTGEKERKSRGRDKDKDKDKDKEREEKEKKPREKSRSRNIFGGRKRSTTVVAAGSVSSTTSVSATAGASADGASAAEIQGRDAAPIPMPLPPNGQSWSHV